MKIVLLRDAHSKIIRSHSGALITMTYVSIFTSVEPPRL